MHFFREMMGKEREGKNGGIGVFEVESLNFILYIRTMPRAKVLRGLLLIPHTTKDAASSMNQTPTHSIKLLTKGNLYKMITKHIYQDNVCFVIN